jgi:CRP-like cAMP-binding protein
MNSSEEEIALIAKGAREVRCDKGDSPSFIAGYSCTGFHIVVFGQVKLSFTSAHGVEKILEIVQQGQSFGEAMMFLEKPYARLGPGTQ